VNAIARQGRAGVGTPRRGVRSRPNMTFRRNVPTTPGWNRELDAAPALREDSCQFLLSDVNHRLFLTRMPTAGVPGTRQNAVLGTTAVPSVACLYMKIKVAQFGLGLSAWKRGNSPRHQPWAEIVGALT